MIGTVDMLDAGKSALATAGREITTRTQNKMVQPVGGVGVILAHAMINEHGQTVLVAQPNGRIDHRIVPRPKRLLKPAQNETSVGSERPIVEGADPWCLTPVSEAGWEYDRHDLELSETPFW